MPTANHLKSNTISSAINLMYNVSEDDLSAALITQPVNPTPTKANVHTNMSSTITNIKELSTSTHNEFNLSKNHKDINQSMHENIIMTLAFVKRIEGRLDGIEAQLQSGVTVINTKINNDILSQLPMKTVSDVEDIETKFTTDADFKSQMRNVIFRIGGTNSKNFIKRALQRLFTNELSTKYTWTGFRQHNFLRGLQIIEIVKEIAVNSFSSTESDFEAHVKDWFRHGSQRFGREKK
uniref:DUF4806 domain-containing protein n=1 Tax=Sipha flava TaxID=143950 RepID=A0A2S2PXJ0_9HEMI